MWAIRVPTNPENFTKKSLSVFETKNSEFLLSKSHFLELGEFCTMENLTVDGTS